MKSITRSKDARQINPQRGEQNGGPNNIALAAGESPKPSPALMPVLRCGGMCKQEKAIMLFPPSQRHKGGRCYQCTTQHNKRANLKSGRTKSGEAWRASPVIVSEHSIQMLDEARKKRGE